MAHTKLKRVAIKTAKVLAYVLLGFVGLFVVLALAIQIGPVQNFIVGKATRIVSDKTNTRVEIDHVRIRFPNAVVLKGVFLEDQQKDTLLSAGSIRVHMNFFGLIRSNVNLSNIVIEDFYANVYRMPNDSAFNFSFIPEAFSDSTKAVEPKDTAASGMDIVVGNVRLKNFRTKYDDHLSGNFADASIGLFEIDLSESSLLESRFVLEDIVLEDSRVVFTQSKIAPPDQDSTAAMPFVGINTVDLRNVALLYEHKAQQVKYEGTIGELGVRAENMDIPNQNIHLGRVELNKSTFTVSMPQPEETAKTAEANESPKPWNIRVDRLALSENNVGYDVSTAPRQPKGFDPNHIRLNDLLVDIRDFNYNGTDITADVGNVAFVDGNGFRLREFNGNLAYTETGISLKNFELRTDRSHFSRNLEMRYASMAALSENLANVRVDVQLEGCQLAAEDLYYLVPAFAENPPVRGTPPVVTFNVSANGLVGDLHINRFAAAVGSGTRVDIKGNIKGLPEAEKAYYDIDINDVTVIRSDALAFIPRGTLPENINLPQRSSLDGNFTGTMALFNTRLNLNTTSGNALAVVKMDSRNRDTSYTANVDIKSLNLAYLLSDTSLGPVTLSANVDGKGLSRSTINTDLTVNLISAVYNGYTYRALDVDGRIADQTFEGKAEMRDTNLAFTFDGLVKFEPDSEKYVIAFNLQGADLQALNFYDEPLRVSFRADADLAGNTAENINGSAAITKLLLVKDERNYKIDSVAVAALNKPGSSDIDFKGGIIEAKYNGTMNVGQVVSAVKHHISQHFELGEVERPFDTARFEFNILVNNSPIITEVLVPGLGDFMPLEINGKFNNLENNLSLSVTAPRIEYNGNLLDSLRFNVNSNADALNYELVLHQIVADPVQVARTVWKGTVHDNELRSQLSILDKRDTARLVLTNLLRVHEGGTYRLSIVPDGLVFNGENWKVPDDNFVQVGGEQLWVHNMKLTNDKQSLAVESPGNGPSGDLNIAFDDFALATLSRIAEQDSALVRGMLNGTATLKMGGPSFAFNADLRMDSVSYQSKPIGSLIVQGNSEPNNTYAAYVRLFDYGNEMEVRGTYTATENPTMNFKGTLKQLTMQTVAALSADQLREPQGHMHGTFAINGSPTNPRIGGQMTFHDASFVVAYLNSFFSLQRESFAIENQAVRFNNFTVLDSAGNKATINGNVSIADLTNPVFSLDVNTEDFRVINTNATRDELFYGLILLDSDIRVRGDMALPRVQANLRIEDGSYFTVGIPESEYAVEYGEGVVKFTDPKGLLHPIMTREHHDTVDETGVKGMDIAATIAINRFSTFTLVVDPETGDSLVVRGDASMAFALNPSGNMSLTGTYAINEGSYRLSVQNLAKRDIDIQPGSTITWNGSPTDAMLDLQARYDTRASPIDLMANELVGLDESQSNPYRQKLEFWVLVNIDGPMLTPEMSFELQMPPEDRGALNGSVNAKLLQLNDDPSSLNKQVFALIVLNRFVQDDPLERSGDQGMETVARQSVSKFLSQQLNRLASNYSQVVDLTFDLQSYNDYSSGESEGRTELNVGLQKKLFNDRLTVQFGGSLDLEGERVQDNQVSDLAGDVSVEYALTKDGRWRMRFFQERKYGGLLEGEINERGLGVIFTRDFDKWSQLFTKPGEDEDAVINDVGTSKNE